MLKLMKNFGVRIFIYCVLTALGAWFYLGWQGPTLFNQILFGLFGCCLLICCLIDTKLAIERFLKTEER